MTTNATTNATPGFPPDSAVVAAAAATATADNNNNDNDNNDDDNDNDNDDGVDLNALCRCVRDLRRMLDASTNCLVDAEADAAVAPVECARTSELAKRRAGEQIC